ncbi:MAG: PIN domain-containing protein [Deltaproteobacteria bacterium]|nr:PIN domain-containing protein [Deltaproteobacteria bacterium]
MKAFIDTNLFVYATYSSFPEHSKAKDFLKNCLQENDLWYFSWGVIYEYLRVVTHPQLFKGQTLTLEAALQNVVFFSSAPNITILAETEDHLTYLRDLSKWNFRLVGNLIHDAHHVALMREHDISIIYTADSDLHRFPKIKVVNPLL